MRVLVAVVPRAYRETLALTLDKRRPTDEVKVVDPSDIDREVRRFGPHLLVCNDKDITENTLVDLPAWIIIMYSNSLDAIVSVDGQSKRVEDIGMEHILGALGETERLLTRN